MLFYVFKSFYHIINVDSLPFNNNKPLIFGLRNGFDSILKWFHLIFYLK